MSRAAQGSRRRHASAAPSHPPHPPHPPLGLQLVELGLAVPQVVAHRVARLMLASPRPSARDRREFRRMGDEKLLAFGQSWLAMATQAALVQQQFATALMGAWLWPWRGGTAPATAWWEVGLTLLRHGLAPVHRRALANARRLRRTPLR